MIFLLAGMVVRADGQPGLCTRSLAITERHHAWHGDVHWSFDAWGNFLFMLIGFFTGYVGSWICRHVGKNTDGLEFDLPGAVLGNVQELSPPGTRWCTCGCLINSSIWTPAVGFVDGRCDACGTAAPTPYGWQQTQHDTQCEPMTTPQLASCLNADAQTFFPGHVAWPAAPPGLDATVLPVAGSRRPRARERRKMAARVSRIVDDPVTPVRLHRAEVFEMTADDSEHGETDDLCAQFVEP